MPLHSLRSRPAIRRGRCHPFRRPAFGEPWWRSAPRARAETAPCRRAAHERAGSALRTSQAAARSVLPELPAAIRTLRRKRSRPIRLTGEPEKKVLKPASSSRSSEASVGDLRSSRATSLAVDAVWANLFHGQTARLRRSHRCGCRWRCGTGAGSAPCSRSSGRRCSAAHRAGTARERHRYGQMSRQARQLPQWSVSGPSGSISAVVKIEPRRARSRTCG